MKNKDVGKTKNSHDVKSLHIDLARTIVGNVSETFNLNKTMQILICNDMGLSSEEAAMITDSTPGYVHNVVRRKRTEPKLREKFIQLVDDFPDWYRGLKKAQLPLLATAETAALEKYLSDPELLIKHPVLARQLRTAAGIPTEPDERPQLISLQVQLAVQNFLQKQQEPARKAARVIDVETSNKPKN